MISSASIIIPTLNEEKYLPRLLESLSKISAPLDIIVVDGDSEDGTAHVLEKYQSLFSGASSLRLLSTKKRNISFQRNLGAEQARHDTLIFCDADMVIPSPDAYILLISRFSEGKYVAAAPRLVPIEPGIRLRISYGTVYLVQRFLMLFARPYFAGSYLVTKKETFVKVGGFDTRIAIGEDVDYSLKAAKTGSCALINIPYTVSGRRVIKYGYSWIFIQIPNLLRFLFTGRILSESIFYPFGEFGGQQAHRATQNRGKTTEDV